MKADIAARVAAYAQAHLSKPIEVITEETMNLGLETGSFQHLEPSITIAQEIVKDLPASVVDNALAKPRPDGSWVPLVDEGYVQQMQKCADRFHAIADGTSADVKATTPTVQALAKIIGSAYDEIVAAMDEDALNRDAVEPAVKRYVS